MGIYSAAAIVLQPLVGRWVDRLGRRPFQLAGTVLLTLVSLAFALTERLGPLFPLLRILQGIGHSLFFVSSYTLVADLVPPGRRGQALGIFGLSGLVSTAVAPTLGELVIHAFGFRAFFLSTGALGLSALLVTTRLREWFAAENALVFCCAGLRRLVREPLSTGKGTLAGFMFGELVTIDNTPAFGNLMTVRLRLPAGD